MQFMETEDGTKITGGKNEGTRELLFNEYTILALDDEKVVVVNNMVVAQCKCT